MANTRQGHAGVGADHHQLPRYRRLLTPLGPVIGCQAAVRIQGLVHDETQMSFGGVKASRYGRLSGVARMYEFTELRWTTITSGPGHDPI